jgi:hypothetical protein
LSQSTRAETDGAQTSIVVIRDLSGQTETHRPCRDIAHNKTFADVLNAISKDAATAVIKSICQNVSHDIDLRAISRRCDSRLGRLPDGYTT